MKTLSLSKNKFNPKKVAKTNFPPISAVIMLCIAGVVSIYSVTKENGNTQIIKQLFAIFLGLFAMFVISRVNYELFLNKKIIISVFCTSVFLLVLTLLFGNGDGNRSWIGLGGLKLNIQPSEIVKPLFILTYAKHLDCVKQNINKIYNIFFLCIHGGIIMGLVALQGDLGSALIYLVIFLAMGYCAGVSLWYFIAGAVLTVGISPYIWSLLKDYQKQRILVGFNPERDPKNYGYQQILSKKAIASAGLFGKGYGKAVVSPDIPYNHTDLIFSVYTEQFGIIGAVVLLAIIVFLVVCIIKTASRSRKDTGSWICMGVGIMIIAQTCENIGMCLGLLPIIGITLPFISYGGSSILSLFISLGLVLSVDRFKNKYYFEREPS